MVSARFREFFRINDERPEVGEVRRAMLDRLLLIFSLLGLPAVGIGITQSYVQERWIFSLLYAVIYLIFLIGTFASRRLPFRSRALILVSSLFLISLVILLRIGMSGVGLQLMLGVCFLVGVLFGVRSGMLAILISLGCIGCVAFGMTIGFIAVHPEHMLTSKSSPAWITALCIFFMMASIMVLAPEMFRRRIEESISQLQEQKKGVETVNRKLENEIRGRRQAEQALMESEHLYRLITESSLTGIYIIQDNHIVYANKKLCEMGGYQPEEILGRDFSDFLHRKDLETAKSNLEKRLQGLQVPSHYQVRVLKRDGSYLWVDIFVAVGNYKGRSATIGNMIDISTSKQVEAALRERDKTLFQIIQGNSIPTFVIDREHVVSYWNKACENLTGISANKIVGTRKHRRAFYSEERPLLADLIVEAASKEDLSAYYPRGIRESALIEGAYEVEDFFPSLGGKDKWLFFAAAPLRDSEGEIIGAIETLQDITERKRTEEALREGEQRYRTLFDSAKEGIIITDENFRFINGNLATVRMFGYANQAEMLGIMPTDISSPTQSDGRNSSEAVKEIARHVKEKGVEEFEWLNRRRNGETFPASVSIVKFSLGGRDFYQMRTQDITERKSAERSLRQSEFRFRSFFNSNPEGIVLMDLEGTILDVNRAFQRVSGHSQQEMVNRKFRQFVPAGHHGTLEQAFLSIRAGSWQDVTPEIDFIRKDGTTLPISIRGWLITDEETKPISLGVFVRDLSEEKALAEEKETLKKQLTQAQRIEAIGTLAGGIAHDFNNILGGIIGYTELALMDESPDPDNRKYQYLSRVLEAGNRAKDLIQQILRFSRQDSAAMSLFSIAPVVKESVKLLRATLPKSIEIQQHVHADPDRIMGDPTQTHQVIMNLCTNAYHAMRDGGGVLAITLENARIERPREFMSLKVPPGDYLRLSISDTGPGISPQILERIFEPYFTTKKVSEGTGLGLSVTLGIVKGHNGLIEVTSRVGEGARFDVYFPVIRAKSVEAVPPAGALPAGHRESVLVVDDELFFLDVLKENLQALGYLVTANQSSLKTLETFKGSPNRFDLVITDQSMPEMTGVQLVSEIRKYNKDIPIILCTGYSEIVSEQSATYYGISKLLMKPIAATDLAWAVHDALRGGEVESHG